VAGYAKMVYPRTVTHPSINRARRRVTPLIETNALPLSQVTTKGGVGKTGPFRGVLTHLSIIHLHATVAPCVL